MTLSHYRMFSPFSALPHLPHLLSQSGRAPNPQNPSPPLPTDSPSFLRAGSPRFEPALTHEIRRTLDVQAASRAGDVP
jgi:hypothetical protein